MNNNKMAVIVGIVPVILKFIMMIDIL